MSSSPIYIFVGESGCGKTSIVQEVSELLGIPEILSYTTRDKRRDTESGYHFVKPEVFEQHKQEGLIFESTEVGFNYYWTLKSDLEFEGERLLITNVEGLESLRREWDPDRMVVIYVSSDHYKRYERLMEDYWYNNRGGERYYHKQHAEDAVRHRMERDKDAFQFFECNYVLQNNNDFSSAVEKAIKMIYKERAKAGMLDSY